MSTTLNYSYDYRGEADLCTCWRGWWGIIPPPPCPVHGPGRLVPAPYHTYIASSTTKLFPCNCTGACRVLGYCPSNPPAKTQALRPEDV